MIRKFNYTFRRKIFQRDVLIRKSDENPASIQVVFNNEPYRSKFPSEAAVFVEAYHRLNYKRFDFGTVGAFSAPEDISLKEFSDLEIKDLRFMLKVVDIGSHHGRLLGVAKNISFSGDDNEIPRRSILGVACRELGDQLWALDLEEDPERPWLLLNEKITTREAMEIAKEDSHFFVLVYPEVVRKILTEVIIVQADMDYEHSETGDEWQHLWVLFGKDLVGADDDLPGVEDTDLRKDWIEDCVQAFCRIRNVKDRYESALREVYA